MNKDLIILNETKFLIFFDCSHNFKKKTKTIVISNKQNIYLGEIVWQTGWKRYVFTPYMTTIYDSQCLKDITEVIDKLMNDIK